MALLERVGRAGFRRLFEEATGLRVAHYPRLGAGLALHAGGHTFVVRAQASARAAPVARAAALLRREVEALAAGAIPMLVVPYMGATGAGLCRERGVGFLDLSGNAEIRAPGLHVRVAGRRNRFPERGRPASPFSPKSSRVARALLAEPRAWWLQQRLAGRTGLGPGFVSRIVRRLEESGLLERDPRGRVRPSDVDLLLEAWGEAHRFPGPTALRCDLEPTTGERLPELSRRLRIARLRHAAAGPTAARLRLGLGESGGTRDLWLYVAEPPDEEALAAVGVARSSTGGVRLLAPRDAAVLDGVGVVSGVPCVSPLQAWLDLRALAARGAGRDAELRDLRRQVTAATTP